MNTLDYLTRACRRVLDGDPDGAVKVLARMSTTDRLRFDWWLVQAGDPLAWQAGPVANRFCQLVSRMVDLERARRTQMEVSHDARG